MIDIDDLVKAVVDRQMAKGVTSSDAHIYALGYLVSFVNTNLIDTAPAARRKQIGTVIADRVADIDYQGVTA